MDTFEWFEWLLIILGSLILLFAAGYAFYITFKKYEEDDDFTDSVIGFEAIQLIMEFLLLISKKIAPEKHYIVIFKTLSFLFGLILLGFVLLLWLLLVISPL